MSEEATVMRPWRFVIWFGTVSLLADFVYEGARSVTGPLLASLGASAALIGVVTGAGEAAALLLRLGSGPLADRSGRFWGWAIAGYALTVASVPALGATGVLWIACVLVIAERVGKAVRAPAKDTLLSHATAATGRGRGFAVHEAMDQVGALIGPLTVAGMLALTGDDYGPALGILALPGIAVLALLFRLRRQVPDPAAYERAVTRDAERQEPGARLPRAFWVYASFTAATMAGFATFGVLSFHIVARGLLPTAAVPLLYAAAMAVDALAALATGWAYDRVGPRVLIVLPLLSAAVPALAFTDSLAPVVLGSLLWGAATGVQESTLRATVADLVAPGRRATAYGVFAAFVGAAAFAGGALTGVLYDVSIPVLIAVVAAIQAAAVVLLAVSGGMRRRA
ncbi:MFS transporter [Streptomyces antnestii]|uniref:MFS transporter n=1 Tax=Streptomyces antnestii TaxID=2494256 RepID=A0A3S2VFZ6_9ACTN|nr:MFS transporter [Streptomyces sp. San01]RVU22235.1 MFS transporter [Streptomyces sp. San01]